MTVKKHLRNEYVARINRVIDHIERHIDKELTLKNLAQVANFSPFHFHRIFRAMIREPLNQFIQRLRIEKAASQLIDNPKKTITEIAFDCGFSGSAPFARLFKKTFHMSASEWRSKGNPQNSKNGKTNSKDGEDFINSSDYYSDITFYVNPEINHPIWRITMKNNNQIQVEVKDIPDFYVAYLRYIGSYDKLDEPLFSIYLEKLMKWAKPRGLTHLPELSVLAVFHDDDKITDEDKLRTSICLQIPENTAVDGEIGKMIIPGGQYAVVRYEISIEEFDEAWDLIMGGWLPESGYQPDDRSSYQLWHSDPRKHPEKKHNVDIRVPIKPL